MVSYLVLQTSWGGRESWLLNLNCVLAVMWLLVMLVSDTVTWVDLWHMLVHRRKQRILSPLRSLRVRNEADLVPLACEDDACLASLAF